MGKVLKLWDHQRTALNEVWRLYKAGVKDICMTGPTGSGKTICLKELIRHACSQGLKVALYTNRIMLIEQTSRVLSEHNVDHGVMANGYNAALLRNAQICSLQTAHSRSIRTNKQALHQADIVLVDEAHAQKAQMAQDVFARHREDGACLIGFTATPIAIGHMYKKLVVAGTTPELMQNSVLLPCVTHGPDEPDLRFVGRVASGEYNLGEVRKVLHKQSLYGRVIEWWKKLNPEGKPTILFAPGVPESKWFVDQFSQDGVAAGHIDGNHIYWKGEEIPNTTVNRHELMQASKSGEIQVLCNRFVLREGIDAPWLAHCIMATPFGSLTSYLQAGGRLLRVYGEMKQVVLQDHGGNAYRHGSLNEERKWDLQDDEFKLTRKRERQQPKPPKTCPQCKCIRKGGKICPLCGYEFTAFWREVLQADGTLKQMVESGFQRIKRQRESKGDQQLWRSCYYAALNSSSNRSMKQVAADFKHKMGRWPDPGLRGVPSPGSKDWGLSVTAYHTSRSRR